MSVQTRLRFLLNDLQSPINIGQCLRTAETYDIGVLLADPRGITADEVKRRTLSDFSCGALERRGYGRVGDVRGVPVHLSRPGAGHLPVR